MAPTRTLLAAATAAATILASTSRAQDPAPTAESPSLDTAPVITLIEPGEAPRRIFTRTLQPGVTEQMSTESIASAAAAVMDGKKYPPTQRPPTIEQLDATVLSIDESGAATIRFTVTQLPPAAPRNPQRGVRIHADLAPVSADATLRIDTQGVISDFQADAPDADEHAEQLLGYWFKKLPIITTPFPDQEIGQGARWTVRSKASFSTADVDQTIEYTLESIDDDQLTITAAASASTNEDIAFDTASTIPGVAGSTITSLLVKDEIRLTVPLDRFLPVAATDNTEIVMLSNVETDRGEKLQLVQYVRNRFTGQSAPTGLANVEPDPE